MSDERRSAPLAPASYHSYDDAVAQRAVVQRIVEFEMACPDDHWNDEIDTRPDAPWQTSYHSYDDAIAFGGRPYDKDKEAWINAYIEAENKVIELRQGGHARARGIIDLPYEMAFTCDTCGLWSYIGHRNPKDAYAKEEQHGALFNVRSCEKDAISKVHGKPFDHNGAFDRSEATIISSHDEREGKRKVNVRKRNKRKAAEYSFYWRIEKKGDE